VCRVPVAVQIATGDDARSLRLLGHQPHRACADVGRVKRGGCAQSESTRPASEHTLYIC